MKQDQESLGRYLKRERETRHVTVEEVALFVGVKRSLADALEADDLDFFAGRTECLWLVKRYAAHLNLNQSEVFSRFEAQWKITGGVKRYPKLTHFPDRGAFPAKPPGFIGKKLFAGNHPTRRGRLALFVGGLIVATYLFSYLPDVRQAILPPGPPPPSRTGVKTTPAGNLVITPVLNGARNIAPAGVSAPEAPHPRPGISGGKPASLPKSVRVVGNRDTKRYHLPGMKYYDKVKAFHRVVFQSEQEALRAGYGKARE